MHLLALAIEQAGSTDSNAVRSALENLKATYQGLIKTYTLPFTPENHDALGPNDYIMVRYEGDKIAESWTEWDTLTFMRNIGAAPTGATA